MVYLGLIAVLATAGSVLAADLRPSCSRPIYCDSQLLHQVNMARLFQDSKNFVDLALKNDEDVILQLFDVLLNETGGEPSRDQLQTFVDEHFSSATELEDWTATDYTTDPKFLVGIRDETLRQYGKDINEIWPTLGRKIKPEVIDNPGRYSIVPITHGFIIPGGRFKEIYYWDTYWIIEGLLISGMKDTARGMLENFFELLNKFGHIPNGGRWYYQERSQPPLLSAMMSLYFRETKDVAFLRANIDALEKELNYWLDNQVVEFVKDGKNHTMLRYYAPSEGPRPESYYEDYTSADVFITKEQKDAFFTEIKSAAESGWDFSSRWFVDADGGNSGNLTNVHTTSIIPVDQNAIFANALQNLAYFQAILMKPREAARWGTLAKKWRESIDQVLWSDKDAIWYDYNFESGKHREFFYPSNVAPLWMGTVEKRKIRRRAHKILNYLQTSKGLDFPGGVPTSLLRSGEQWDFPNAWPPLVSIMVNALEALGTDAARRQAFQVAETWVRACHKGFSKNKQMFEKYDVETPGLVGGGGEYVVQTGFGWSNGVVLEFLAKYGRSLTAADDGESNEESADSDDSPAR